MATYRQIQDYVKTNYGYQPKTCWIAHMKEVCGLNPRVSARRYSLENRVHPCPENKQADLKQAFRHFHMIQEEAR